MQDTTNNLLVTELCRRLAHLTRVYFERTPLETVNADMRSTSGALSAGAFRRFKRYVVTEFQTTQEGE